MIYKVSKSEIFWFFLMCVILYGFAYGPIIYNYLNPIPDRAYLGFTNFPVDMLANMTLMQEGYSGRWMHESIITAAVKSDPEFVKVEYIIAGHIARIINISILWMYRLFVFFSSLVYLGTVYFIVKRVISNKTTRIFAFLFILFGTGIGGNYAVNGWEYIYTGDSQVFQRLVISQPHYMLGGALSLISAYYFIHSIHFKKTIKPLLAIAFGLSASQIFSPAMLVILGAIPIYIFINFILKQYSLKKSLNSFAKYIFYSSIILLPVFYLQYRSQFYPMNTMKESEKLFTVNFGLTDYLNLIGPMMLLCIITVIPVIKKRNISGIFFLTYAATHIFLVLFQTQRFGLNAFRFLQSPYFVIYGILAAIGLEYMIDITGRKLNKLTVIIFSILLMAINMISGKNMYKWSYMYIMERNRYNFNELGYLPESAWYAMKWLSVQPAGIIISETTTGTLLQALTTNTAYITGWINSNEPPEKDIIITNVRNIFKCDGDPETVKYFLSSQKIKYIYQGKYEKEVNGNQDLKTFYPFLDLIYDHEGVRIYSTVQI